MHTGKAAFFGDFADGFISLADKPFGAGDFKGNKILNDAGAGALFKKGLYVGFAEAKLSADFYSTEGTDIVEYLREVKSTTPSEWAKLEIEKAKKYGFLPDYMQNNYQNNITRAEFCTILTWMIEEKTGKGITQLIDEKGTPIKSPFEDTYYEYADYMCKLGIVNGVSATGFNPLGEITREQAIATFVRMYDNLK